MNFLKMYVFNMLLLLFLYYALFFYNVKFKMFDEEVNTDEKKLSADQGSYDNRGADSAQEAMLVILNDSHFI